MKNIIGVNMKTSNNIIDRDFSYFRFEKEDFRDYKIHILGDVRFYIGRIYTDKEWETKRERVLSKIDYYNKE